VKCDIRFITLSSPYKNLDTPPLRSAASQIHAIVKYVQLSVINFTGGLKLTKRIAPFVGRFQNSITSVDGFRIFLTKSN
jgi:hypothetical protein